MLSAASYSVCRGPNYVGSEVELGRGLKDIRRAAEPRRVLSFPTVQARQRPRAIPDSNDRAGSAAGREQQAERMTARMNLKATECLQETPRRDMNPSCMGSNCTSRSAAELRGFPQKFWIKC